MAPLRRGRSVSAASRLLGGRGGGGGRGSGRKVGRESADRGTAGRVVPVGLYCTY